MAPVKVAIFSRPGLEPHNPVLRSKRWPNTSNVLITLLFWPLWLTKKDSFDDRFKFIGIRTLVAHILLMFNLLIGEVSNSSSPNWLMGWQVITWYSISIVYFRIL